MRWTSVCSLHLLSHGLYCVTSTDLEVRHRAESRHQNTTNQGLALDTPHSLSAQMVYYISFFTYRPQTRTQSRIKNTTTENSYDLLRLEHAILHKTRKEADEGGEQNLKEAVEQLARQ